MVTIKADAKINLTLDILGKRPDGYHEVAMVMQEISLADEIRVEQQATGIRLELDKKELPADNSNLAWKAAQLFIDTAGLNCGVSIKIKKNIPIAAGLAGGSADAAGVLRGMNELFDCGFSVAELCKIGEKLGSDVPFCICGGTMLATGRGEILRRLPNLPECFIVIAKPPISVSTAWAYKTYDELGADSHPDNSSFLLALERDDFNSICELGRNVLEDVTKRKYSEINRYKEIMYQNGARMAMMSGSGPTVFALTEKEEIAVKIAAAIRENEDAEAVYIVKPIYRNE